MSNKLPPGRNFYVMRHAETEDNVNKVVSGSASVTMLTEEGRRQAIGMQQILVQLAPPVDRVVTSEMRRAIDTAELACDYGALRHLPHSRDRGLNERAYGVAEGMPDENREKIKIAGGVISGQESKEDLCIRTVGAIIRNLGDGGIPLFITHGGNIRRVLEEVLGKDRVEKNGEYITNCTLCEFLAPENLGGDWKVNILELSEHKEIKRRRFGKTN